MTGRVMFGYRHGEVSAPLEKLRVGQLKDSFRIDRCRITDLEVKPQRPISRTLPVYFTGAAYCRPDPDYPPNLVIGVLARIAMKPPKPNKIILACLQRFTLHFCQKNLTPLEPGEASFENWIEKAPYPEHRKKELRDLWFEHFHHDPRYNENWIKVKSFIKDEPYDTYKAARSINSRADWFKCFSGPLFSAIGKKVFHEIPEFIKTVPVRLQPDNIIEAIHDAFSSIANNDATSYEAHFTPDIMKTIEFVLYDFMVSKVPLYQQQMDEIEDVLSHEQKLTFKLIDVLTSSFRMSGEMNTSLGNGFTTLILVLFLAWIRDCQVKARVEGDDNLSRWQFETCLPTERDWERLGWKMKVERPDSACHASFCGNVFDEHDRIVIVDPREALLNFGWVRKSYVGANRPLLLQLMRSKGLSMAHQYNGCPMLGAFGRRICDLTSGIQIRPSILYTMNLYEREQYLATVSNSMPTPITPSMASRWLVFQLYGITIDEQLTFESSLNSIVLDCAITPNFLCTGTMVDHYDRYTAVVGEHWCFNGPTNHDRIEALIRSHGPITQKFCTNYYDRLKSEEQR
jgi:hypothetical protein